MNISEIKKAMKDYRDFFGGTLIEYEIIDSCKTKKELADVIDNHNSFIEAMATDAQRSLGIFKQKVGLSHLA